MEPLFKAAVLIGFFLAGMVAFFCGSTIIAKCPKTGKQWVDLGASTFGAISFVAAALGLLSLLRHHDGRWLLDYPMIGEPGAFHFLVPLCLAIAVGLSLAKRFVDLKLARKS